MGTLIPTVWDFVLTWLWYWYLAGFIGNSVLWWWERKTYSLTVAHVLAAIFWYAWGGFVIAFWAAVYSFWQIIDSELLRKVMTYKLYLSDYDREMKKKADAVAKVTTKS